MISQAYSKQNSDIPVILIVDDIPKNLQVLGNILKQENYKVSLATSGRQALKILETLHPDLILLDIMMNNMDGFTVCKTLKKQAATRQIPIIFISAKGQTEDIVKGLKLGAVDYITKPFNATELLARVNTHISLKRAHEIQKKLNRKLKRSLEEIKQLRGLLPICANCKKIRDDAGFWHNVEEYISDHSEAKFTHGLCPGCIKELYPRQYKRILSGKDKQK